MQITDEMGRALVAKYREFHPGGGWPSLAEAKDLLRAALSASPAGVVKPLEWKQAARNGSYIAHGIGILYAVDEDHDGAILAKHSGGSVLKSAHANAEAAKSAAFADYSARIMSAIEQDGVGVETPPPSSCDEGDAFRILQEGIKDTEADIAFDADAGNRSDLSQYGVSLPYETARQIASLLRLQATREQVVGWAMTNASGRVSNFTDSASDAQVWKDLGYSVKEYVDATPSPQPRVSVPAALKGGEQ